MLARAISARLKCDVHRIEAADAYPADYDETVERNVREHDADERPAIADRLASIDGYHTILLASPIWNVRAPKAEVQMTSSRARACCARAGDWLRRARPF